MLITSAILKEIAAMPAEAMAVSLLFLAGQLEQQERTRTLAAERQSRKRKRDKVSDNGVTNHGLSLDSNGEVTLSRVEDNTLTSLTSGKEESKNLPLSPSKPLSSDPDGFEEFWNLYPKREKNYDRKGAVKAFRAALKRTDLQTILDGARAYADYLKANNKLNTEFVKQARSWLNGDFWTEFKSKPQEQSLANGKTYVKYGTDAGDAWVASFKTKGKIAPRDSNGGWFFPTEFPPATQ